MPRSSTQALATLLDRHRAAEIDAAYATYDEHPLEEADVVVLSRDAAIPRLRRRACRKHRQATGHAARINTTAAHRATADATRVCLSRRELTSYGFDVHSAAGLLGPTL
jgi:hypothetical protein